MKISREIHFLLSDRNVGNNYLSITALVMSHITLVRGTLCTLIIDAPPDFNSSDNKIHIRFLLSVGMGRGR